MADASDHSGAQDASAIARGGQWAEPPGPAAATGSAGGSGAGSRGASASPSRAQSARRMRSRRSNPSKSSIRSGKNDEQEEEPPEGSADGAERKKMSMAARKRISAKRLSGSKRSSALRGFGAAEDMREDQEATGIMHDYLRRIWSLKKRHEQRLRKGKSLAPLDLNDNVPFSEVLKGMRPEAEDMLILEREKLRSALRDSLTVLWKTSDHKTAWQKTNYQNLVTMWKDLYALKLESKRLKKQTLSWHFRHYILKERAKEKEEKKQERHFRLQDLWIQMHGRHANCPLPREGREPVIVDGRKGAKRQGGSKAPAPSAQQRSNRPTSRGSAGGTGAGAGERTRRGLQPGTPWKSRPALSKCSGGSWDWARGSPHTGLSTPARPSSQGSLGLPGSVDWWTEVDAGLTLEDADLGAQYGGLASAWTSPSAAGSPLAAARASPAAFPADAPQEGAEADEFLEFLEPFPFPDKRLLRWWKKPAPKEVVGLTLKPPVSLLRSSSSLRSSQGSIGKSSSLPSLSGNGFKAASPAASPAATPAASPTAAARQRGSSKLKAAEGGLLRCAPAPLDDSFAAYEGFIDGCGWSPASPSPFVEPWQGLVQLEESPSRRYLRACQKLAVVPALTPFVTGDSSKITNLTMEDHDLAALTAMLDGATRLDEVDLSDNRSLTDPAVADFFETLCGHAVAPTIQRLSLLNCPNLSSVSIAAISQLLESPSGVTHLSLLDVSSVRIGLKSHLQVAAAIRAHPRLQEVRLACTGLGGHMYSKHCVSEILSNTSIHTLDLSWNCFSAEVFNAIGERVVGTGKIRCLRLASCAAAERVGDTTPLMYFIEQLSRRNALEELDITNNLVDYRAALIIEDSLEFNGTLASLNISKNPLGVAGIRSFLRLLSRDTSGLKYFDCSGSFDGTPSGYGDILFSCTSPAGKYALDLYRPYHRSILRMLYKISERLGMSPQDAFNDIGSWSHPAPDEDGVRPLPMSGRLSFTFSIEPSIDSAFDGVGERDFEAYLSRHYEKLRITPSASKVVPLMAEWNSINTRTGDQMVFLDALSKDFRLTYPHLEMLCRNRDIRVNAIRRLIPNLSGGLQSSYMVLMLAPCLRDFTSLLVDMRTYLSFNVENPTGHYWFDLQSHVDFAMAERLALVDQWEVSMDKRLKRFDTSQRGNRSHIRNERYCDKPLPVNSIREWIMPESGVLEFDYSSGKRPKPEQLEITDAVFDELFIALSASECTDLDQVEALRAVSHHMYLTSVLFRQLLGIYKDDKPRAELFVLFFFLVSDIWNEKIFRVRFEDKAELARLQDRLGFATFFPYIQPEQVIMDLDFSNYDQRVAVCNIVNLANKENPANLRDVVYILPDGRQDPLALGIPRSWETLAKIPTAGKLKFTYVCSAEERNLALRKRMLSTYGFWECPITSADEVRWWAALDEAPEVVLEFLEFLSSRFTNLTDAFTAIDGVGGNGNISLREFEEGFHELGCKKFEGPDETKQIHAIFRYLDPSGEGQVSLGEWLALDQIWNEIKLSLFEFVQFMERTFAGGLAEAWQFIDDDGSGGITLEEWIAAIQEIGYFGPTTPIFNFLDKDDEGDVSYEEYVVLEAFSTRPKPSTPPPETPPQEEEAANSEGESGGSWWAGDADDQDPDANVDAGAIGEADAR